MVQNNIRTSQETSHLTHLRLNSGFSQDSSIVEYITDGKDVMESTQDCKVLKKKLGLWGCVDPGGSSRGTKLNSILDITSLSHHNELILLWATWASPHLLEWCKMECFTHSFVLTDITEYSTSKQNPPSLSNLGCWRSRTPELSHYFQHISAFY